MNLIKDVQELTNTLGKYAEVIAFPIGAEGQRFFEFLKYTNLLHNISCVAMAEVNKGLTQLYKYNVPILPFDNLVMFHKTAIFLVVGAAEQYYGNMETELSHFGFKNIFFVTENVNAQIKNQLQDWQRSGELIMWYMRYFEDKINSLEHRISIQNEISDTNKKAFAEYRNAFRGRDVVIVACGPTLNYYTPMPDAIHIGVNFAYRKENIPLDFSFHIDLPKNSASESQIIEEFETLKSRVKKTIFMKKNFPSSGGVYAPSERFTLIDDKVVRFFGADDDARFIYQDICYHPLREHWTVTFTALHFALFTYPARIFLVGCDTNISGHFYGDEPNAPEDMSNFWLNKLKVGYAMMKMFAQGHYPDTEIISINPVGLRGLFKDVYTDEYKSALAGKTQ